MSSEGTSSPAGDGVPERDDEAPARDGEHPGYDTSVAHQARVYDYLLGGKDNFAADREVGETMVATYPDAVKLARANRAFLGRAVRFLAAEAGIRQFLD
ncbi:MAG: SAM-dependent methyltransferase, partial [Nocardiopsaceae bacterium]|nr:SAM-dependent methyltransferase [Nocardiopsaceae bacterium]